VQLQVQDLRVSLARHARATRSHASCRLSMEHPATQDMVQSMGQVLAIAPGRVAM